MSATAAPAPVSLGQRLWDEELARLEAGSNDLGPAAYRAVTQVLLSIAGDPTETSKTRADARRLLGQIQGSLSTSVSTRPSTRSWRRVALGHAATAV